MVCQWGRKWSLIGSEGEIMVNGSECSGLRREKLMKVD